LDEDSARREAQNPQLISVTLQKVRHEIERVAQGGL
jgi:hypothetical protein